VQADPWVIAGAAFLAHVLAHLFRAAWDELMRAGGVPALDASGL